jgi:hypothetical protein
VSEDRTFATIDEAAAAIVAALPLRHASQCDATQYAALKSKLTAPLKPAPVQPYLGGKLLRDMTPEEVAGCYRHFGIRRAA